MNKPASHAEELSQMQQWLVGLRELYERSRDEDVALQHKADASPVTAMDRRLEQYLREQIMQAYPQDGIIGEEFPPHQPQAARQWVIDPIDGTRAFIAGWPTFTTLIALIEDGKPRVSAMLQPITGELWLGDNAACSYTVIPAQAGIQSDPAKDSLDSCLRRNDGLKLNHAIFSTTSPLLFRAEDRPKIESLMQQCAAYQLGGDGYAYGKLACGRVQVIVESGMQPYDFLPLVPIVQGAGGRITDWQGQPLTLKSSGDVIATTTESLHQQVIALLSR